MDNLAKEMAYLAHRAAINEIAEIQARMAQRRIIQEMHGTNALPIREFFRVSLATRQQTLSNAPEMVTKEAESDEQRLDKLYEIVQALEVKFKEFHDADDAAFAQGVADYIRESRKRA